MPSLQPKSRPANLLWRALAFTFVAMPIHAATCNATQFEGAVEAGKSFSHRIDATHDFLLEAIPSGWIVRVLQTGAPRPPHDYAELATPPYRSPNPILISTDFAFRAQDAVAWNPREFHFFTDKNQLATATKAYEATEKEPNNPSVGAALYPLIAQACTAEVRIIDARIVGGANDQSQMAATVASHFAETAHTVDTNAPTSKLGRIETMRFRVTVQGSATAPRR